MKTIVALLCLCFSAMSMERVQGWCEVGNKPVVTSGINSTTRVQASYPNCTVNVYITGSGGTHAALFSDSAGAHPLSNPFAANSSGLYYFYTANGKVDVTLSGGSPSMSAPITFGDINVFDFGYTVPSAGTGCWVTNVPGTITLQSCTPGGISGSVQYNSAGSFAGSAGFTWSNSTGLNIATLVGQPALTVLGVSTFNGQSIFNVPALFQSGTYDGLNQGSTGTGAVLSAFSAIQTPASGNKYGGYMVLSPITYNPYNGAPCVDEWGNPVQQPLPLTGGSFGDHDAVMWVGTSPSMPLSGSCGVPLPGYVDDLYGLNISHYVFSRGGFGTDNTSYNSIQSLLGGSYMRLGGTYDQGIYMQAHPTSGTLNTPSSNCVYNGVAIPPATTLDSQANCYGALAYQGGSVFWYYNNTAHAWATIDFSSGGGGGGGTPATPFTSVQFNNAGSFGGSSNLTWASNQLTVTGTVYSSLGLNASYAGASATDTIQATSGGVTAKWLIANDSLFLIQESAPAVSGATQFKLYGDSSSGQLNLSKKGAAYVSVASFSGTLTNGHCVSIDGSGNFVDAGGACTTGSGGGTVSAAAAGLVPYYTTAGTGTTVGGAVGMSWDNTNKLLNVTTAGASAGINVTTGWIQSDAGFHTASTSTTAVNAPNGQIAGKTLYASDSLIFAEESAPALSASGQARVYADTSHVLKVSYNGAAYVNLGSGGGGSPGGSDTNIQFNNGGAFGGSANLVWLDGPKILEINNTDVLLASSNTVGSLVNGVATHYSWKILSSGGFGLLALANGSGAGGYDGNGASVYCTASDGICQAYEFKSGNTGTNYTFANSNSNFLVNGNGDVSNTGVYTANGAGGGFNVTANTASNSIQTVGGVTAKSVIGQGSTTAIGNSFTGSNSSQTLTVWNTGAGYGIVDLSANGSAFVKLQIQGHIVSSGAAPSIGACGSFVGSPTDTRGSFMTTASGCTLTFAASYASTPVCVANVDIGGNNYAALVQSAGTGAVTFNSYISGPSHTFTYICMQ